MTASLAGFSFGFGKSAEGVEPRKAPPKTPAQNYVSVARGPDFVLLRVVGLGNMQTAPILAAFTDEEFSAGCRNFIFDLSACRGFDSTFMGCMVGLATSLQRVSSRLDAVRLDAQEPLPPGMPPEGLFADSSPLSADPAQPASGAIPVPAAAAPATADVRSEAALKSDEVQPLSPEEASAHLRTIFTGRFPAKAGGVIAVNVSKECRELLALLGVDQFVKIGGRLELAALETVELPGRQYSPEERRKLIYEAHKSLVEIDRRNQERFGAFLDALSAELSK